MKELLLVTALLVCTTSGLFAQDAIYTANGNRLDKAPLIGLTDDKIKFRFQNVERSFQRQNILFAFSQNGHFLIISELDSDLTKAQQQLKEFLSAPVRSGGKDYLIKALPLDVIPAEISYESDDVVNYKTNAGKSASISKRELAAIIHRDGRHKILRDPVEVAGLLADVRKMIKDGATASAQPAITTNAPTTQALPTQSMDSTPTRQDDSVSSSPQPVINITNIVPGPSAAYVPESTTSAKSTLVTDSAPVSMAKATLNETEYQSYRRKALQKVDEFVIYLNVITDKKRPTEEKDEAIRQATKLFMPAATIEVTSVNRPGARRYPIRDYLTRLKLLPYSSAKIEWSEVQYLKELSQAADGNYYGVITGEQTFIGYGKQGHSVIYTDVVQKNVRVKLQSYVKEVDGRSLTNWDVLLGSIGVAAQ